MQWSRLGDAAFDHANVVQYIAQKKPSSFSWSVIYFFNLYLTGFVGVLSSMFLAARLHTSCKGVFHVVIKFFHQFGMRQFLVTAICPSSLRSS